MSHFTVAVFTEDDDAYGYEGLLERYDEDLATHMEVEEDRYETLNCIQNIIHTELRALVSDDPRRRILNIQDDSFYPEVVRAYYGTDEDKLYFGKRFFDINQKGEIIHSYNPDAKWDWYSVGGRWSGELLSTKDGTPVDRGYINELNLIEDFGTYAVVTPDGEWHEPGAMGWFGISLATDEEYKSWHDNYHKFIEQAKENDWYITIIDCHI